MREVMMGAGRGRARPMLSKSRCRQSSLCIAALAAAGGALLPQAAEAKSTGWLSKSELSQSAAQPWVGYGESGYVGRPAKSKRHAKVRPKSKSKSFSAAVRSSGYATKASKAEKPQRFAALESGLSVPMPPETSLTGGGVRWVASLNCLNGALAYVVEQVGSMAPVTVNSTCRSRAHNARVGGARRSHHLTGNAVDFRVHGNVRAISAFLRSSGSIGGFKHYGGGLFHIDLGPKRTW